MIERQRAEEIECPQVTPFIEPTWQNPDDFVRLPVDADHPADDVMSRTEALLPAALTQYDYVVVSRDIFSRKEIATELRLNTKHRK